MTDTNSKAQVTDAMSSAARDAIAKLDITFAHCDAKWQLKVADAAVHAALAAQEKPEPGVAVKGLVAAARAFMEIFVGECGDQQCLTVEDIDHNEMAQLYDALSAALVSTQAQDFKRCVECDGYNCDDGRAYPFPDLPEGEVSGEPIQMHRTRHKISELAGWSNWSRWEEGFGTTDDTTFEIEFEHRQFFPSTSPSPIDKGEVK